MASRSCLQFSTIKLLFRRSKHWTPVATGRRWASHAEQYRHALNNVPQTRVTALRSGLRVASEDNFSPVATVGVWIEAGSRHETEKNNGAAHFFEHMAFKGTAKRSQLDLELEVENLGMHLNSYTTREHSAFFATCMPKDVPKAVEILSDVLLHSTLSESDIEKERGIILGEMDAVESDFTEVVFDYVHATAYQGTPLGKSIFGTTKNVKAFTSKDLQSYVKNNYKANRMVLAAAGGVHHEELVSLAEKHMSAVSTMYEEKIPDPIYAKFTGSELRHRDDDMPLCHAIIAMKGAAAADEDTIPLLLAREMIGSWDRTHIVAPDNHASHIAAEFAREPECHSFQSFNFSYSDTGLWGIYFVGGRHILDDILYHVTNQWMLMCNNTADFALTRAKNALKTNLMSHLSNPTAVCEEIGRHMMSYGRRIPLAELDARIDAVSAEHFRDVCMKYIYDRCPAVAAIGPVEALTEYNRLRGQLWWMRT